MLQVVRGADSTVRWVQDRLPWVGSLYNAISFAVIKDGKLVAAAVYNNFYAKDCQLTFVSDAPQWASRQVLRQILGFPFYETDRERITTLTDANNHKAINLNLKLGFQKEGVLRHGSPVGNGNDGVICGLTKEDFIRSKYSGQRQRT